jgi:hypothetical protein
MLINSLNQIVQTCRFGWQSLLDWQEFGGFA